MKFKKAKTILLGLLITINAAPFLSADDKDKVFTVFLTGLTRRHEALNTLAMPKVEVHTAEGFEDEAVYIITFKTPDNAQTFITALKAENIFFGTFPQKENQVMLFYTDMIRFLFMDVIGL